MPAITPISKGFFGTSLSALAAKSSKRSPRAVSNMDSISDFTKHFQDMALKNSVYSQLSTGQPAASTQKAGINKLFVLF